jgi:hypothetical protein
MMNKNYFLLSIVFLLLCFTTSTVKSQVLIYEDFEDNINVLQDLPGWNTALPPFVPTTVTPCEDSQSVRINSQGGNIGFMEYLSQVTTGEDIDISFQYKVIDNPGGGLSTGNPVSIDLSYTVDNGTTWNSYDMITTFPTSNCSTHTATIPAIDVPAGSDFGWRMDVTNQGTGVYVYVDDFLAVEQVQCIQPINVEVDPSTISFDGATINWEDLNTPVATSYTVYYCTAPSSNPGGPNTFQCQGIFGGGNMTVTTTQATLTGLTDGQDYWVYVVADCGGSLSEASPEGGAQFQTIAIGSYCEVAIDANGPLPYTDSSQTDIYGFEDYNGAPGGNCGTPSNILDGNEVVYTYTPTQDDILTVTVSNLDITATTGLFIYEDCDDIGGPNGICFDGGSSTNGQDIEVNSLFVDANQQIYIVIATVDSNGDPVNSDYTIDIEGFDCPSWTQPNGDAVEPFVAGQTLGDFSNTSAGVTPTINGATLQWYTNNGGMAGTPINPPLSSVVLNDQDVFFVTQNIANCESPALMVTFEELDCLTDLGGVSNPQTDEVCETGELTLSITKNSSQYDDDTQVYWFDQATGGEVVGVGPTFTTPTLTQTTSYYATEVFLGEGVVPNQANLGPVAQSTSSSNFGVVINATEPMTIVDVQVYVAGSGNLEVELAGGPSGFTPPAPKTIPLTGGTAANPTLNTLNLNYVIPSPGQYYLRKVSGPAMYYTTGANTSYPYSLGSAGEVTSGANTGGNVTSGYYYFYNWTIRGPQVLCETSRVEVEAIVHDILPITASAANSIVCVGATADLTVTSNDPDYEYTWTWPNGGPLTGANVQPTVLGNTTFTVEAYNPFTTCSTTTTIDVQANGVGNLGVIPVNTEVCSDDIVKLTAGSSIYDFENGSGGFTTVNNSSAPNGNVADADWKIVNSPYSPNGYPLASISSSDNSNYYISNADKLNTGSTLDNYLISPSINLVGVSNVEVSFEFLYKDYGNNSTNNTTEFDFLVRTNQGNWNVVENNITGEFDPSSFTSKTIDISQYVGEADVEFAFHFNGSWGWWLAIDNVVVSRDFNDGLVSWSPTTDLYFDDQATIPYDGSPVNELYFTQSNSGQYTYNALLDFTSCPDVTSVVDITVYFTDIPVIGSPTEIFIKGETVGDLDVTGTDLTYYILDENGDYDRVTINYLLNHNETYYVTQTLNGCESDYAQVTVELDCPQPTNLELIQAVESQDGTSATILLQWDEPADVTSIEDYIIVIKENGSQIKSTTIDLNDNKPDDNVVINDLPLDANLTVEIYSLCDSNASVESDRDVINFSTSGLEVENIYFANLSYYPNPTRNVINFENNIAIDMVEIYSLAGQKVLSKKIGLNKTSVSMDRFAAGTYFAVIYVESTKKVVRIIKE